MNTQTYRDRDIVVGENEGAVDTSDLVRNLFICHGIGLKSQ